MSIEEQLIDLVKRIAENSHFVVKVLKKNGVKEEQAYHFVMSVSYTHLTLPTIYSV